jgi:hypothetical protein
MTSPIEEISKSILTRKVSRLRASILKFGTPIPPVGSEDYAGISGTFSLKSKVDLLLLLTQYKETMTGFVDLGSGTGEIVYTMALQFPNIVTVGVEASKMICDHSASVSSYVCTKHQIENPERISFVHQNILDIVQLDKNISCVFSFAVGMPLRVFEHIIDLVKSSEFVKQFIIVYRNLKIGELISYFDNKSYSSTVVSRISMMGSGQKHQMFMIVF